MENFKIESRYQKLCYGLTAFIRYLKAVFYRTDYKEFLMCPLIKTVGQAFVSKNAAEPFKRSAGPLKHPTEHLRVSEKTKSSVACLCCNWHMLSQLLHYRLHCSSLISFPSVCTSLFMFHLISFSPHLIDHVSFLFLSVHSPSYLFYLP